MGGTTNIEHKNHYIFQHLFVMKNITIGNIKVILNKLKGLNEDRYTVNIYATHNIDTIITQLSHQTTRRKRLTSIGHSYNLQVYDQYLSRSVDGEQSGLLIDLLLTKRLYNKIQSQVLFDCDYYAETVHVFLAAIQPLKNKLIALKTAIDDM